LFISIRGGESQKTQFRQNVFLPLYLDIGEVKMSVNEFFQKYNGHPIDYDGSYGNQCVDLYRQYCKEVLDVEQQSPGVEGAYQIWTRYRTEDFDRIANTPEGVPQLGDVIIWDKTPSMNWGHVAIFKEGNVQTFLSFDQNWPVGSLCHFQNHSYKDVLGWLRPKNLELEITGPEITEQTKIDLGEPWGIMEVQAIRTTLNNQAKLIKKLEKGSFWYKFLRR
jgi:hypothetical protein